MESQDSMGAAMAGPDDIELTAKPWLELGAGAQELTAAAASTRRAEMPSPRRVVEPAGETGEFIAVGG